MPSFYTMDVSSSSVPLASTPPSSSGDTSPPPVIVPSSSSSSSSSPPSVEFDASSYLESISSHLLSVHGGRSPSAVIRRPITENIRPVLIRTLLGLTAVEYRDRLRRERSNVRNGRLSSFVRDELLPHLSDATADATAVDGDGFGHRVLRRLSTGRAYRGSIEAMLADVGPPSLLPAYEAARREVEYAEAASGVVRSCAEDVDDVRREAAAKCLSIDTAREDVGSSGRDTGRDAEEKCAAFVHERWRKLSSPSSEGGGGGGGGGDGGWCDDDVRIFRNVHILSHNGRKKKGSRRPYGEKSGHPIIYSSEFEEGRCGELDAVVLRDHGEVVEVWESKHSMSVLTIENFLCSKLIMLRKFVKESRCTEKKEEGGESGGVVKENENISSHYLLYRDKRHTFRQPLFVGMHACKCQDIPNAAHTFVTTMIGKYLAGNVQAALSAIEAGTVEVNIEFMLNRLEMMKEALEAGEKEGLCISFYIMNDVNRKR